MPMHFRKKWLVRGLLTGLALAIGCAAPSAGELDIAAVQSSEQALRLSDFNTRELITGVVLMDGPAAALIPTIRDNWALTLRVTDTQQLEAHREFASRVLDELLAKHQEQTQAFRAGVLSGDRVRIQKSIQDIATLASEIGKTLATTASPAGGASDDGRGLCTYEESYPFYFDFDFDLDYYMDVIFNNFLDNIFRDSMQGDTQTLLSEQAVDEIASLAAPN